MFERPEHQTIADMLRRMDHRLLQDHKCWFGGGTAIVLRPGECRRSLDVDFLCSDAEGYREIRNLLVLRGAAAAIASLREDFRRIWPNAPIEDDKDGA